MRKPRLLDATPYPVNVWFVDNVRDTDRARLHAFAIKQFGRPLTEADVRGLDEVTATDALGCCTLYDGGTVIIQARTGQARGTSRTIILSHEALHAVFFIFASLETEIHSNSDHPFIYLHDHLLRQMLEAR